MRNLKRKTRKKKRVVIIDEETPLEFCKSQNRRIPILQTLLKCEGW
jgi:hypothetical protein